MVFGAGQTDTIESVLPEAIVVQLHEPGAAGQIVQFQSDFDPATGSFAYLQATDTASQSFSSAYATTTDGSGLARVYVRLNTTARSGKIIVRVPAFGLTDSVSETATPGAPVGLQRQTDTAVTVGATDTLNAYMFDQYHNRRSDPVTYKVISGPITLSNNAITGSALGVALITETAKFAYATDTTRISVVPQGTIAFGTDAGIVVSNLGGSAAHVFPVVDVGNVRWAPDGKSIAYDNGSHGYNVGSAALHIVTLSNGTTTTVDTGGIVGRYWPEFSRDGTWLYWTDILNSYSSVLWRAHPDGTMKDSIPGTDGSWTSSPSPDGSQLVYSDLTFSGLHVITLATGTVATFPVHGFAPKWAPTGTAIAYLAMSQGGPAPINIIQSNGTGNRVIGTRNYDFGVDWSPDGQWLIALDDSTAMFDIINVSTGMTLPLPFTSASTWSPSWGPTGAYPISHAYPLATRARPRDASPRR